MALRQNKYADVKSRRLKRALRAKLRQDSETEDPGTEARGIGGSDDGSRQSPISDKRSLKALVKAVAETEKRTSRRRWTGRIGSAGPTPPGAVLQKIGVIFTKTLARVPASPSPSGRKKTSGKQLGEKKTQTESREDLGSSVEWIRGALRKSGLKPAEFAMMMGDPNVAAVTRRLSEPDRSDAKWLERAQIMLARIIMPPQTGINYKLPQTALKEKELDRAIEWITSALKRLGMTHPDLDRLMKEDYEGAVSQRLFRIRIMRRSWFKAVHKELNPKLLAKGVDLDWEIDSRGRTS